MKKYFILAIGLLCFTIVLQRGALKRARGERDRYKANTESLINDLDTFKTKAGLSAAKVGQLELTVKELKRKAKDDYELIKELKGKKDVTHYSTVETVVEVPVVTEIHDTLVKRDSVYVPMKCLDYNDGWVSLDGCFEGKEFMGRILVTDSLVILGTEKRKRFLGFLWKTKKVKYSEWTAVSKNPHTKIQHIEVVKVRY